MADPPQVGRHPVPVEERLHRAAAGLPQAPAQGRIVEQPPERLGHRLRPLGIHQHAGLAVAYRLRNAAASAGHHRHTARRGLDQRDAEAFDALLQQARHPEVDLGDVVERRQVAVRHVGQEAHPVADAELASLLLQRLVLLPYPDHGVPEVGMIGSQQRQRTGARYRSPCAW